LLLIAWSLDLVREDGGFRVLFLDGEVRKVFLDDGVARFLDGGEEVWFSFPLVETDYHHHSDDEVGECFESDDFFEFEVVA